MILVGIIYYIILLLYMYHIGYTLLRYTIAYYVKIIIQNILNFKFRFLSLPPLSLILVNSIFLLTFIKINSTVSEHQKSFTI